MGSGGSTSLLIEMYLLQLGKLFVTFAYLPFQVTVGQLNPILCVGLLFVLGFFHHCLTNHNMEILFVVVDRTLLCWNHAASYALFDVYRKEMGLDTL